MRRIHLFFAAAVALDLTAVVLILIAFADYAGTSIPPQDPTPAVAAAQAAAVEQTSARLLQAVVASAVLGAVATLFIVLGTRARRRERAAAAESVGTVLQRQ
ncbi:hypothetical protein AB0B66_26415 [Catellatospora sp. NPDC049111]|uniref:hypothetical protein n=1 Tax=Catellatospora sp. NPDC049111 TaxID=3155271 RepID=UPI0033FFDE9B